jgi:hypothetical protein
MDLFSHLSGLFFGAILLFSPVVTIVGVFILILSGPPEPSEEAVRRVADRCQTFYGEQASMAVEDHVCGARIASNPGYRQFLWRVTDEIRVRKLAEAESQRHIERR